jgi:hypothetical protein
MGSMNGLIPRKEKKKKIERATCPWTLVRGGAVTPCYASTFILVVTDRGSES